MAGSAPQCYGLRRTPEGNFAAFRAPTKELRTTSSQQLNPRRPAIAVQACRARAPSEGVITMHQIPKLTLKLTLVLVAFLAILAPQAGNAQTEKRMALVIGNGAYQTGPLATPANDAGLIAQTLQAAGFDVVGARDLDTDSLTHAFRDFIDSASKAGPGTVAAIYFAGYGMQLEGENYLLPIDATITRDTDIPLHGLRLSDYTHALAGLGLKATIVVLDAARANPFQVTGQPLAGGLALVDPEPGELIAFNAMPGTVAPDVQDGYGPYAKALAEMMRQGGLQPADLFGQVRL